MISLLLTIFLLNGVLSHNKCGFDEYKQYVLDNDIDGTIHEKLNKLEGNFESERHKHTFNKMVRKHKKDRRRLSNDNTNVLGLIVVKMDNSVPNPRTDTRLRLAISHPIEAYEIKSIEIKSYEGTNHQWISGAKISTSNDFTTTSNAYISIFEFVVEKDMQTFDIKVTSIERGTVQVFLSTDTSQYINTFDNESYIVFRVALDAEEGFIFINMDNTISEPRTDTYLRLDISSTRDIEINSFRIKAQETDNTQWIHGTKLSTSNDDIYGFVVEKAMKTFDIKLSINVGEGLDGPKLYKELDEYNFNTTNKASYVTFFLDDWDGKDFKTSEYFVGILEIPVIVHVLYNKDATNELITNERIQSQILRLNVDYLAHNTDILALKEWNSLKANYNIVFKLSQIRRIKTNVNQFKWKDMKWVHSSEGGSDIYDSKHYLNLYVGECDDPKECLGQCSFPGSKADEDACIIKPNAFGDATFEYIKDTQWKNDLGTIDKDGYKYDLKGRTATHEVGHWLNLEHTFGTAENPTCDDTDHVKDTPNQNRSSSGCPSNVGDFSNYNSCGTNDMYQNYMDYSNDECMGLFTNGQLERSLSIFKLNHEDGGRKELTDYQSDPFNDRYVNDIYLRELLTEETDENKICGPTDSLLLSFGKVNGDYYVYLCASTTNNKYVQVANLNSWMKLTHGGRSIKEIEEVGVFNGPTKDTTASLYCLEYYDDIHYLCYMKRLYLQGTLPSETFDDFKSQIYVYLY